jgi:hypothetical protein
METYVTIMPTVELSFRSVFFFFCMIVACTAIITMFTLSKSKTMLGLSSAISAGIVIIMALLLFPIGPGLGQMIHFPSVFDTEFFTHCENPKLIGPLCYFFLLVESILFVAMLKKGKGRVVFLLTERGPFVVLTLSLFNIYNLMTLTSFVDRAHLQMIRL